MNNPEKHIFCEEMGFTEVYNIIIIIIFLFWLKNTDCGCSLEPPHQGTFNKQPESAFGAEQRTIQ